MIEFFLAKRKKHKLLKIRAETLWESGYLKSYDEDDNDSEIPLLGEQWPKDVLPFWRMWAKASPDRFRSSWCSIEDALFWKEVLPVLQPDSRFFVLIDGAQRGNLTIFNASSSDTIAQYAQKIIEGEPDQDFLVHPDVLQWMLQREFWTTSDIHHLIKAYDFMDSSSPSISAVYGTNNKTPFTSKYIQHWYLTLFKNFELSANEQATIINNFFETVSPTLWFKHIHAACKPFLHSDLDLDLLLSVSRYPFAGELPELKRLHEDVVLISTHLQDPAKPFRFSDLAPPHPALLILMDLEPIETPMDLYRHAKRVKDQILNTVKQINPALDFKFEY